MRANYSSPMVLFFCPGCQCSHGVFVDPREGHPCWKWNGNVEKPTLYPSIDINRHAPRLVRCHSFVRDGRIQFLSDSSHALAGQTVDLPEWDG